MGCPVICYWILCNWWPCRRILNKMLLIFPRLMLMFLKHIIPLSKLCNVNVFSLERTHVCLFFTHIHAHTRTKQSNKFLTYFSNQIYQTSGKPLFPDVIMTLKLKWMLFATSNSKCKCKRSISPYQFKPEDRTIADIGIFSNRSFLMHAQPSR